MKILAYILSIALTLNLGTHVKVMCETPICAMSSSKSCACDMGKNASDSKSNSCCQTKIKCQTNYLDGNTISELSPVFKTVLIFYTTNFGSSHNLKNNEFRSITQLSDSPPNPVFHFNNIPLLI